MKSVVFPLAMVLTFSIGQQVVVRVAGNVPALLNGSPRCHFSDD